MKRVLEHKSTMVLAGFALVGALLLAWSLFLDPAIDLPKAVHPSLLSGASEQSTGSSPEHVVTIVLETIIRALLPVKS